MRSYAKSVARIFLATFLGPALFAQFAALVLTVLLVLTGVDWKYYEMTRSPDLFGFVVFAGLAGAVVPVFMPLCIAFFGYFRRMPSLLELALKIVEAEVIGLAIVALYKAFTGRLQPNIANGVDISHAFQFGFLRNGIFWGWPSSHTVAAFAGAMVVYLATKNRYIRTGAIVYALLIGFGASVGFHWLSDVLAGAIIGTVVAHIVIRGITVS